jgi:hypothetical protein
MMEFISRPFINYFFVDSSSDTDLSTQSISHPASQVMGDINPIDTTRNTEEQATTRNTQEHATTNEGSLLQSSEETNLSSQLIRQELLQIEFEASLTTVSSGSDSIEVPR